MCWTSSRNRSATAGGVKHRRKALRRTGPRKCFAIDDLYTARFGGIESRLRRDGRPPSDVRLWLGSTPVDGLVVHEATMGARLSTFSSKHRGYFSVLTVGHLVILCSGRCNPSSEPLSFDARTKGKAVLRLWPASIRTAQWPPAEVIQDLGLEALGALI